MHSCALHRKNMTSYSLHVRDHTRRNGNALALKFVDHREDGGLALFEKRLVIEEFLNDPIYVYSRVPSDPAFR